MKFFLKKDKISFKMIDGALFNLVYSITVLYSKFEVTHKSRKLGLIKYF